MGFDIYKEKNFSSDTLGTLYRRAIDYGCIHRYLIVLAIDSLKYTDYAYLSKNFWFYYSVFGLYMLFKDAFPKKSVTKYLFRLDIVDINGNDARFWQRMVRNITLVIPLMDVIEGIFLVCNVYKNDSPRRIGDILAKTYVISTGRRNEFQYMANIKRPKKDELPR